MESIEVPDYSAWLTSSARSTTHSATATDISRLLDSGSKVTSRLGPLAHSESPLPREPYDCFPFLPQWTWKKADYSLLVNETGQPLFLTITDDDEKCVQQIEPTVGGSATGANVGLKINYVWRETPASGRALINGETATIEYVKRRRLTIGFGRHVNNEKAPTYYSIRWNAEQLQQAIKYTFRVEDADEALDTGRVASWNEYTWHSGKPQAKADDGKKKE